MKNYVDMRRLEPWRSHRAIAGSWAGIAAIYAALHYAPSIWAYVLAAPLLGAFQNRLTALIHEGQHRLLHHDPKVNDRLCGWTCAFPLGNFFTLSRKLHNRHHSAFGKYDDPSVQNYTLSRAAFFRRDFLRSLTGVHLFGAALRAVVRNLARPAADPFVFAGSQERAYSENGEGDDTVRREYLYAIALQLVFIGLSVRSGDYFAYPLWLWARLSFCNTFNIIRLFTEHHSPADDRTPILVNVRAGALERFLISPLNFHHHGSHHLATYLPYYQLPELTRRIVAEDEAPPFQWKEGYFAYAVVPMLRGARPERGKMAS